MRVRPAIVSLCALALGAVGTVAWLGRDDYDPTAGPIDSSQNGLAYSQPVEVGQDFSIGITTLYNSGKKPVLVKRVRLLGVTGPLELLGVNTRLFPEDDEGIFFGEFGFPRLGTQRSRLLTRTSSPLQRSSTRRQAIPTTVWNW